MKTTQKEYLKVQEAILQATEEQRIKLVAANKAAAQEILQYIALKYASEVTHVQIGTSCRVEEI